MKEIKCRCFYILLFPVRNRGENILKSPMAIRKYTQCAFKTFAINYRLCSTSLQNLIDNKRPTEISVNRILIKVYRLNGQYYLSRKLMAVPLPLPVIVPMIIAYVHYQLPMHHKKKHYHSYHALFSIDSNYC